MKQFLLPAAFVMAATGLFSCNKDDNNSNTGNALLETVFKDPDYQFTGVAKDPTGTQLLINYPRWSGPYKWGVITAADSLSKTPFPDEATNTWIGGQDGENKWVCVQSVHFDKSGTLWVLDPAAPNMGEVALKNYKLVRMNKTTGAVERKYEFDAVASDTSYINDVRVDADRQFAYMTNSKEGGILVTNLATGQTRQVLYQHTSTRSDPAYQFVIDGKEFRKNGMPVKIHSDGLALTPNGDWLYYKPLTDDKLYRIRTEFLRDESLSPAALGEKVEDLGHKCASDGMIFDEAGNLYLGDMQNYRIVKINPAANHEMTTLVRDNRLIWPDSYAVAGGYLYITCSQINKQPDYNAGVNKRTTAYGVYRIKI